MRVKWGFGGHSNGLTFPYHFERGGTAAGASAGDASPAGVAAGEVFWRPALPGFETHHADARPAHRVRERAVPEHGGMLGARHGDVHDSGGYLYSGLRILRRAFGQACRATG